MAINFPTASFVGQPYAGFIWDGIAWGKAPLQTALQQNLIVNPCMQISQQNEDVASSVSGYYLADQWALSDVTATGVPSVRRYLSASANGNPYRLYMSVVTAQAAMAANEYAGIYQMIEGYRIAPLGWGTAKAIPAVLRFWAATTTGQTYTVTLRKADYSTRISFLFAPTASWTRFEFPIPAETVAAWERTTNKGAELWFTVATGTTQGSAAFTGDWMASGQIALAGQDNLFAAVSNVVQLCDVGLYPDPYATGIAPPWQTPNEVDELRACQRYWYRAMGLRGGATASTTATRIGSTHPVQMRTTPALSVSGSPRIYDGTATPILTGAPGGNFNNINSIECSWTTSGLVTGRPVANYYVSDDDYIAVNARM